MLRKHFAALSPLQPLVALQHKNHKVMIPYFLPLYKIFGSDARKVCTREQMAIRQWKAKRAETCSICRINTMEANTHAETKNHFSPSTCQISLGNPHTSIKSEITKVCSQRTSQLVLSLYKLGLAHWESQICRTLIKSCRLL